jgi:hypothetical protein
MPSEVILRAFFLLKKIVYFFIEKFVDSSLYEKIIEKLFFSIENFFSAGIAVFGAAIPTAKAEGLRCVQFRSYNCFS